MMRAPCPSWPALPLSLSERLVMLRAQQLVDATLARAFPVLSAHPGSEAERFAPARTNGRERSAPPAFAPPTPREPS